MRRAMSVIAVVVGLAAPAAIDAPVDSNGAIFRRYDFPVYAGLAHLCGQRVYGQGGQHITWDAFASDAEPSTVGTYYRGVLGDVGFSREKDEWRWRLPAGAPQPARVLEISPVGAPGPHRECQKRPGARARTIVMVSRRD